MSASIELYGSRSLTRQQRAAVARAEAHAEIQARADAIAGDRTAQHISTVSRLTRHGLAGAGVIAAEAAVAAQHSPWAAQQIATVAEAGIAGIRGVIVEFAMERK